jgi:ubiquinol-cytochrome c reductase iron-sulfur subunit
MDVPQINSAKRRFLLIGTNIVGSVAAARAATVFIGSMFDSERAKAAGAPVEADISELTPGALQIVGWRGKPVWILRRTAAMLAGIRADDSLVADPRSEVPQQPDYARNELRSIRPDIAVLVGVCTHLGCSPQFKSADDKAEMGRAWTGGFYCLCHGSKFDLAGRVLRGSHAPTHLVVPPYEFAGDGEIIIGSDTRKT